MRVLVVGASGKIGKHLTYMLTESPTHTVRAMVRKEDQAKILKDSGIDTVVVNLEDNVEVIADAAKGCDAIIFVAGSGGSTGFDKTLLIDLDGAVKTMEAAEKIGIKRFLMVSALQANNRQNWNENIKPYYVAKHYADKRLEQSKLTYTIIRPGGLLNDPGTGKVIVAERLESGVIPREDVAKTLLYALDEPATYNRSFDLTSGDTPIHQALKALRT